MSNTIYSGEPYNNHDDFIKVSSKIHKNKYDYSLVEYINTRTKVKIICPEHGIFEQIPSNHVRNGGCNQCGRIKIYDSTRLTNIQFVSRANIIHNHVYDYSLVEYKNNYTKVTVICKVHGAFNVTPKKHLEGSRCYHCFVESQSGSMPNEKNKHIKKSLYVLKFENNEELFYKIGISANVDRRIKEFPKDYDITLLYERNGSFVSCYNYEQILHLDMDFCRYDPLIKFEGHTECFSEPPPIINSVSL